MIETARKLEAALVGVTKAITGTWPSNQFFMSDIFLPLQEIIDKCNQPRTQWSDKRMLAERVLQVMRTEFMAKATIIHPVNNAKDILPEENEDLACFGDYECEGLVGLYRTVLKDESIPNATSIPAPEYWYLQALILYGEYQGGLIAYESRQSGLIKVLAVKPNAVIQGKIKAKVADLLAYLRTKQELA